MTRSLTIRRVAVPRSSERNAGLVDVVIGAGGKLARPVAWCCRTAPARIASVASRVRSGRLALLLMVLAALTGSCRNVNVVTASYSTLDEARAAGAVSGGYLPDGLPAATRDIREAHDAAAGRRWALFSFPSSERTVVLALLEPQEVSLAGQSCDAPGRIEWWPVLLRNRLEPERLAETGLQTYRMRTGNSFMAVNWSQGRAYIWTAAGG